MTKTVVNGTIFKRKEGRGLFVKKGIKLERICDEIVYLGLVREADGKRISRLFRFKTLMGDLIEHKIPLEKCGSAASILRELAAIGFQIPQDFEKRRLLDSYIVPANTDKIFFQADRTGWFDYSYLARDGKVFHATHDPQTSLRPPEIDRPESEACGGSLPAWISGAAIPALFSKRLMFAIAASLSSLLLKLAGVESGLFHFYGRSSTGKSLILMVAMSVFEKCDRTSLPAWDTTAAGFEEVAALHCDMVLVLDEFGHLSAVAKIAARIAREIAFKLTSGRSRRRSSHYNKQAGVPQSSWRVIVLSSGESALGDVARKAGHQRIAGEQVRVIDVPAVVHEQFGIFETVPSGQTSRELAASIEAACKLNYGVAASAFLTGLTAEMSSDRAALDSKIARQLDTFYVATNVPDDGWERRFAERFALAYSAALLGIQYGVLPWKPEEVYESISGAYRAARRSVPDYEALMAEGWRRVQHRLKRGKGVVDLRAKGAVVTGARAFLKDDAAHGPYWAVRPSAMRRWIDEGVSLVCFGDYLCRLGVLIPDQRKGRWVPTRQVQIAGIQRRARYYCVKVSSVSPDKHACGRKAVPHRRAR